MCGVLDSCIVQFVVVNTGSDGVILFLHQHYSGGPGTRGGFGYALGQHIPDVYFFLRLLEWILLAGWLSDIESVGVNKMLDEVSVVDVG